MTGNLDSQLSEKLPEHQLPHNKWETLQFLSIIVGVCIVVGWGATLLNARFYSTNQPFYDSVSYHDITHRVMTTSKEQGLFAGIAEACSGATVCLPFVISAIAGLFVEPSRQIGIWIQIGELAFLCCTLWIFFRRVSRVPAWTAMFATAPILLLRCLYMNNGGLSDYRMDLSLMLLFGATCLWYLIASRTASYWPFVLLGASCAATCLFRGTAPVYFILTLGPIVVWDLLFCRRDRRFLAGLSIAIATAATLSLWFYVANFEHLHYYYFVWNTDANAHLPLAESSQHLLYVLRHIGYPAACYILAFYLLLSWERIRQSGFDFRATLSKAISDLRSIDLRPLWLGIAPVLFLVLRGAGLNPFVCMPAVIGLCLFALVASPMRADVKLSWPSFACLLIALVITGTAVFQDGLKNHLGDRPNSMAAHQQTLNCIIADAQSQGWTDANLAPIHSFYMNSNSLKSVAQFDREDSVTEKTGTKVSGIEIRADFLLSVSAEEDWNRVEGNTTDEKLAHLINQANQRIDYLVIPNAKSAAFLRDEIGHNVINRYAVTLRDAFISSGNWEPISDEIENEPNEVVEVFRNRSRKTAEQIATTVVSSNSIR